MLKMKYRNLTIFCVLSVFFYVPTGIKCQDMSGASQDLQRNPVCQQVEKLHRDKFIWMIERQTDSLLKYLHEDALYIHSNGWVENKKEVIENIRSGKLTYRNVDIKENTCRVDGQTAVITGKAIFFVSLDGKDIDIPLLYTEVYSLHGGQPRLFSRHACRWVTE